MTRADWFRAMPVLIQALVGLGGGAWTTWRGLRTIRRQPDSPMEGVAWEERPLPIRRQDTVVFAFIALHVAGHLALAALSLRDALHDRPSLSPGAAYWINGLGLLTSWLMVGVTLTFPLVYRRAALVPVRIGAYGFQHGPRVVGWRGFSHFVVDAPARVIRAYSAGLPDVARAVWHPPTDALCAQAAAVLDGALPRVAPPATAARPSRWAPVRRLAVGIAVLLLGTLVADGRGWAGAYYLGAAFAMLQLSPSTLHRYQLD